MDHESASERSIFAGPPVTDSVEAPARPDGRPRRNHPDRKPGRRSVLKRVRRVLARVPGLSVLGQAALNYIRHESANQAGHVAFSVVLAMFPFLLFLSAAATFLGEPGAAAGLAQTIIGYAPPAVAEALQPVVDQVLGTRNRTLLTVGIVGTLWAASSGAQAVRIALNRAYGVREGLSFWKSRIKVIVFTAIGTAATVLAFSTVVVLPYLWMLLDRTIGMTDGSMWLWTGVRYGVAFVVLVMLYAIFYTWLPDIPQRLRTVLPGAVSGVVMWLAAAALLSWTLRSAAKLTVVYGGFAGMVATLVFLYASAATLIFGAEINGVLRQRAAPDGGQNSPRGAGS